MLPQFTQYLLQFQQVHIPSLGTLRVVQQPASLDVAAKLIQPPQFVLQFSEDGWLTKHQLWYFEKVLELDETATRNALEEAGLQLKKNLEQETLIWDGVGKLSYANQKLVFQPELMQFLQPVSAERVLREKVQHTVLVGDQVVRSDSAPEMPEAVERRQDWNKIAGWAVIVLSIFFILFYLYQHQFQPAASGLHSKLHVAPPAATYLH